MKATPIINSFTTGEWSPRLNGRTDVDQYYQSAESLLNMIVEFYGGAKKAPGTYFVSEVKDSDSATIIKRFVFSDEQAYVIEIGDYYMRFCKDDGQIVVTASDVSDFDPTASYTTAGEFSKVGNYISLICTSDKRLNVSAPYGTDTAGKTVEVEIAGDDTLAVTYTAGAILIQLADTTPAKNSADLIQTALRAADGEVDDWYVTENAEYASARPIAGVTLAPSSLTDCDKIYFCAVNVTGNATNTSLFPPIETSYWTNQTAYEIATSYPSSVIRELQFAQTADLLYITHSDHPQAKLTRSGHIAWTLTDEDYSTTADIARPALMEKNTTSTTITASAASGAGIVLTASVAIFDETHIGSIWAIGEAPGTHGYVEIISVSTSGLKTVATANVLYGGTVTTVATASWLEAAWSGYRGYPKAVAIHEGRLYYGYTPSQPQTSWGSEIWAYKTFLVGTDAVDPLAFKMDTNEIEAIKWLFPSDELLIGTSGGVHTFGTGSDVLAMTPTNVRRKKKTSYGASTIKPFQIGDKVYYWQEYNRILREYTYALDIDNYQASDATAFSDHISESGIIDMAYQQSPFNILWCVRADGKLAVFTRQIEHKVTGWATHETDGFYESVAVIPKDSYDEVWFIIRRTIGGVTKRYIEYMVAPEFDEQEDAFFVHSGLTLDNPKTISNITVSAPTGLITVVSTSHGYSNLDVVRIRGVSGMTELNNIKFIVADVVDQVSFTLKDTDGVVVDGTDYEDYVSDGEIRKCVNSVSGLDHLEGKTVKVLVDGATHPDRVVSGGIISLDDYYGQISAGLGYTGRIKTNDLEVSPKKVVSHGKEKSISNVVVNFYKTLGARVGTEDQMETIVFRDSSMPADQSVSLFTGFKDVPFPAGWDRKKQIIVEQTLPLPMHVLSIVPTIEVN